MIIKDELISPYVITPGVEINIVKEVKEGDQMSHVYQDANFGRALMRAAEMSFWAKHSKSEMSIEEFSSQYADHMQAVLAKMDKIQKVTK